MKIGEIASFGLKDREFDHLKKCLLAPGVLVRDENSTKYRTRAINQRSCLVAAPLRF